MQPTIIKNMSFSFWTLSLREYQICSQRSSKKNIIIFLGGKDPKPIFAISQLRAAAVDKSNVGGAMLPKKIRVRVMFLSLLEIVIHEFPVTWFETVNADG
jgi:hypothetical protein